VGQGDRTWPYEVTAPPAPSYCLVEAPYGLLGAVLGADVAADLPYCVGGRFAASLTNTNCIESMISIARDTTKNMKRWRDGKMIKHWGAAGMLNAERSFRRLEGDRQLPSWSLRSPVTSKLFHRHGMLGESHERSNQRPPPGGRHLEAGRSDDRSPESCEESP
jgi:hypothetical protein